MKKVLHVIFGCFIIAALTLVVPRSIDASAKAKLSKKSITLQVGESYDLTLKKAPKLSKKKRKAVMWSSSMGDNATIKVLNKKKTKARVTARIVGKTVIRVQFGGRTYSCKLKIVPAAITTEEVTTEEVTTEDVVTPHEHAFNRTFVEKEPTCTTTGVHVSVCSCGYSVKEDLPMLEHEYSDWQTTKMAGYHHVGRQIRICALCGDQQERELPALCEYTDTKWVVVGLPTKISAGVAQNVCTECGTVFESIKLPKMNYSLGELIDNSTTAVVYPAEDSGTYFLCGDNVAVEIQGKYSESQDLPFKFSLEKRADKYSISLVVTEVVKSSVDDEGDSEYESGTGETSSEEDNADSEEVTEKTLISAPVTTQELLALLITYMEEDKLPVLYTNDGDLHCSAQCIKKLVEDYLEGELSSLQFSGKQVVVTFNEN